MCRVSFVTSVYNCEKYIAETIESVLNQTYTDWEYILIDDCSKDKSVEIIRSFDDKRIKLIENKTNQGQCKNLNYGISLAKGEYIARLDHDDICYPDRIMKQIEFMDNNPDVALCGAWNDIWKEGVISHQNCPDIVGAKEHGFSLAFEVFCISHSSYFIRKSVMRDNHIQYRKYLYAEDYDLLLQIIRYGAIDYIREPLLAYRVFPEQYTQTCGNDLIVQESREIRCNYYEEMDFPYKEILKKAVCKEITDKRDFQALEAAIIDHAKYCGIVDPKTNKCVKLMYKTTCMWQKYTLSLYMAYTKSRFVDKKWILSNEGIRFFAKCFLHYKKKEEW